MDLTFQGAVIRIRDWRGCHFKCERGLLGFCSALECMASIWLSVNSQDRSKVGCSSLEGGYAVPDNPGVFRINLLATRSGDYLPTRFPPGVWGLAFSPLQIAKPAIVR
jgi:hypothetical protein